MLNIDHTFIKYNRNLAIANLNYAYLSLSDVTK